MLNEQRNEERAVRIIDSPVGRLVVGASEAGVTECGFDPGADRAAVCGEGAAREFAERMAAELGEYFAGARREFGTPLAQAGTAFQKRVWAELLRIPYGETISYGELSRRIGDPGASRAVGAANGRNRIAVVVPCHRVIDSSGKLHGYGGGLERKAWLLQHEGWRPGLYRAEAAGALGAG